MTCEWWVKVNLTTEEKRRVFEAMTTLKLLKVTIEDMTDDPTHGVRELSEAIDVLRDILVGNAV